MIGYWQTSWLQVKPAFLNLVANLFKIVQQKAGRACNRLNDPFINATTKSLWGGFCNCLKDLQGRGLVNTIVSQNSKYGKVGRTDRQKYFLICSANKNCIITYTLR